MAQEISDLPSVTFPPGASDIYETFRELRSVAPFARGPLGIVMALRHRHCDQVMSDATRQLETETVRLQGISTGPIFDLVDQAMLFSNGEAHRRRRSFVARTFSFKLMEMLRQEVAEMAETFVHEHLNKGPVDFQNAIAAKIPTRMISRVLDIDLSNEASVSQWVERASDALGIVPAAKRDQIEQSLLEFDRFVQSHIERFRAQPKATRSSPIDFADPPSDLGEIEARAQIVGLILAGSDTTRGSVCMTLAHVLTHPEQWRKFCSRPDQLKKGVANEGLRYEPIVYSLPRVFLRPSVIDGYEIPQGAIVALSLPSILRDPDVYSDADTFDIFRTDHPKWHPAFGAGAHRCVGEALARLEIEETLAAVARIAPRSRICGAFPQLSRAPIRKVDQFLVELR